MLSSRLLGPAAVGALVGALACAPGGPSTAVKPSVDPAVKDRPDVVVRPDTAITPPPEPARMAPPSIAASRDLLALAATGVPELRRAHPTYDGRGVLIGIMDSGIDADVPGLLATSTGQPKLLDLRDFSGEGRVALSPVRGAGDTLEVGGRRLAGYGRVAALGASGPHWAGTIAELPLGERPASDLNGDGDDADTLAVVVTRASDGWVLLADTDGDGTLADEKPVRDYLAARETFGWRTAGRPAPIAVAVNVADSAGAPVLDLYFDTSAHGTHVAGIAAGNDIYGETALDGVAPGAQLLGLKISNNAQGGISMTGSMVRAMDYAIRFAEARRMPLVLNMSFGVGNQIEGRARIDALVDSILAEHPDVIFTVSAGNDGPGLTTLGFPASAERVITVGASFPQIFAGVPGDPAADPVAFFSARGGELGKPDFVTPGVAYSTVPRWNSGDEVKGGTSMASPHAAGLAALLVSGMLQEKLPIRPRAVRQALMVTARPTKGDTYLDGGTGVAQVGPALEWLRAGRDVPAVSVRADGSGVDAAFRPRGLASRGDTVQAFTIRRPAGAGRAVYTLRTDAPWLRAPARVTLTGTSGRVSLRYRADLLREPGVYVGVVSGWGADTTAGPAFRLVNTVVVPHGGSVAAAPAVLAPNEVRRLAFAADSARPFHVVGKLTQGRPASLALFEPGGQPYREESSLQVGGGNGDAVIAVDAGDVVQGVYEIDAVGSPQGASTLAVEVRESPVTLRLVRERSGVVATVANATREPAEGEIDAAVIGAQRVVTVTGRGGELRSVPFRVPAWAREVVVDAVMDPEQWNRFTDLGVSVFDSAGRQLGKSPLNYAFGRQRIELPEGHGDMAASIGLFPGLAEPGSREPWTLRLVIRLEAGEPADLQPAGTGPGALTVAPGKSVSRTFRLDESPLPLGDGFYPLGLLRFRSGGTDWTRVAGLPQPTPPVMR
jgi:subtilisin family serine protease